MVHKYYSAPACCSCLSMCTWPQWRHNPPICLTVKHGRLNTCGHRWLSCCAARAQDCAAIAALQMSSRPESSGARLGTGAKAPPPTRSGGLTAAGTTASTTRRQKGHRGVLSGVASHTCSGTAAAAALAPLHLSCSCEYVQSEARTQAESAVRSAERRGSWGDALLVCRCICTNQMCLQQAAHPAQAGRAELVGAAADGHLQRGIEADVALLPGDAGRRRRPALGSNT